MELATIFIADPPPTPKQNGKDQGVGRVGSLPTTLILLWHLHFHQTKSLPNGDKDGVDSDAFVRGETTFVVV